MQPSAVSRAERASAGFAEDVARFLALRPRQLPSHYLYDPLGSALFEAICRLPWYRIATIEKGLLRAHADDIFGLMKPVANVVELGPGSGEKLITLLEARVQPNLAVHLIDVSAEALDRATRTLAVAPDLSVNAHQATYEEGLSAIGRRASESGPTLVLFLGSNIGNFDRAGADTLLHGIRGAVRAGDALLLGADLVKPESDLVLAYDDPLGVTAAFNRNLLVRMNRELGADFNVAQFVHRATWNAACSRMEMHLVSTERQRVRVRASDLDITFEAGESIWTEGSYKYRADDLAPTLARAGFRTTGQWVDSGFALTLAEAE
jgi:L-histidine Nalpha-methyltransferase